MTGFNRVALSNLWLLGPVVEGMLAKGPSTNALMRTTTALTIVNGGNKENVLPGRADATVNFRLLPGDTPDTVLAHLKQVIADPRVELRDLDLEKAQNLDLLAAWAHARPTLLVVSPVGPTRPPPEPLTWSHLGTLALRSCKPNGALCDDVYRLDAARRGP